MGVKTAGKDQHPQERHHKEGRPRPTSDAGQRMRDEQAEIKAEIERAAMQQGIGSLSELQALAERVFQQRNRRPRDEFCGLSAQQMACFLHAPFDAAGLVGFSDNLPNAPDALAFKLAALLIDACGDNGLKATAKGYLPATFCREAAMASLGAEGYKELNFGSEVRKELDFHQLHIVRLIAQMAGLMRKYRGRFLRTKKCERLLSSQNGGRLYLELFMAHVRKFNWAYSDRYEDLGIIQGAFLFSLFLIHTFGEEARSPTFYEEKFLQAFPGVLDEVEDPIYGSKEKHIGYAYSLRTMERFAHFFGLIELDSNASRFIGRSCTMKKAPLFDQLIRFYI
jgi:hypothetical protein